MPLRRRFLGLLAALFFLGGVPLLSTGVDWEAVCTCEVCPLAGGPGCCCSSFSLYDGEGSAGKRAGLELPSAARGGPGCPAGDATVPSVSSDSDRAPRSSVATLAPRSARPLSRHDLFLVASRPLLPLLPRPPPSLFRSLP